jgi:regulator of sigma E protease
MGPLITFIIILSVLVLVHEMGHFFVAKRFGIKIEEFGIGYPPRMWGKKIKGTIYSLNWLPFGGFVRMLGEDSNEQINKKQDIGKAFFNQKKRVRIVVLLAGVVMNFLLGVVLFGAIYTKLGIPEMVDYVLVTGVTENSPAQIAGIKPEDKIAEVQGLDWPVEKEETLKVFIEYVNQHKGKEVVFYFSDGSQRVVMPRLDEDIPEGEGALGVSITNMDYVLYPYWQRPFRGMLVGLNEATLWGKDILVSLGGIIHKLFKGDVPKDIAGPVGIYQISKGVSQQGLLAVLQFMAILSINLSILNLLPLPALDGGRLLFIGIEVITKKRIKPEWEQVIHLVGIVALIGLMVLVTINDVRRLFR